MTGFLHLIVPGARFRLLQGADALTEYTFNTGVARHLFCRRCGIKSFYVPRSNPDGFSVNARCLEPGTIESLAIEPFDGRNWEESRRSPAPPVVGVSAGRRTQRSSTYSSSRAAVDRARWSAMPSRPSRCWRPSGTRAVAGHARRGHGPAQPPLLRARPRGGATGRRSPAQRTATSAIKANFIASSLGSSRDCIAALPAQAVSPARRREADSADSPAMAILRPLTPGHRSAAAD